ncbi:sugar ABC transporter substrate-binding protein [Streptacidiphilus sp. N1-12]|uniref:Sugar ABC transporter substrate-binding protein n=2 Tax=Streptacidiphilus alkalitolerans TaxID=3342712 RepID=A0ABV6WHD3_9ACTN
MRKSVRWGALALGVVLSASACSSGGSGSAGSGSSGGGGSVTLSYGVWDATQKSAMDALAAAFTKTHPAVRIKVELTPWADYWTKLKAAATGGAAPDVFWMNGPNFQLYAANGVIRPLDDDISKDQVDLSVYPAQLVNLYTYRGKHYGLPKDMDTIGVWYNKALFDAAKLPFPKDNWTWSDFQQAAAKLTDASKGQYGTDAELTSFQEYQYNTIAQAGGYVISPDGRKSGYDDPRTIAGLRFWTDLIQKKESPDLKTMTDTAPLQLFEAGKIAMYWGGSWDAAEFGGNSYTKDKVDVAPLPTGAKQATVIHGVANVVSAKSAHSDQAWQFVRFLGSEQAADILGRMGPIPAYRGTQSAWVAAHPQFKLQTFLDEIPYAVPYPVSKNTAAWNEDELTYLTKAWNGEESVDRAAKDLAAAMNAKLAEE